MTFTPAARKAPRLHRRGNARDAVDGPGRVIAITGDNGETIWWGVPRSKNRTQWGHLGVCAGDYQLVDRMYSDSADAAQRAADEACTDCLIREACLEAGLNGEERYGVWGGLPASSREFRALITVRHAEAALQEAGINVTAEAIMGAAS